MTTRLDVFANLHWITIKYLRSTYAYLRSTYACRELNGKKNKKIKMQGHMMDK